MKILAIGDFHGKFPTKIRKIIKREKIDLVVSIGDYPPFSIGKDFFKYVYGKPELNLWDFIGKKEYKVKVSGDLKNGEKVIKLLDKLPVPVLTVFGNHDMKDSDSIDRPKPSGQRFWKFDWERRHFFKKLVEKCKNIKSIYYNYFEFENFVFIGMGGASFPGRVKSKTYKSHRKKLEKLFKKFKKENRDKRVIFVSHNSPYNSKLDKITAKKAHKRVKGKHYGSKLFRRIINKYQPILSLSGHIEEGFGRQKIGKTLAVNCGSIHHGKGCVIDVYEIGKVKVKFFG